MGGSAAGACGFVGGSLITILNTPASGGSAGARRFVGRSLIQVRHTGRSLSNPT
jgi:hypothetical protein